MSDDSRRKVNKAKRNAIKYLKKALNLLKEYGNDVDVSEKATRYLFIGNGGVLCGISRKNILSLFSRFGSITDLVMLPKKSYSFLSYANVKSAERASKDMDGYAHVDQNSADVQPVAPFYVRFLNTESLNFAKHNHHCGEYPIEGRPDLIDGLLLQEKFISEEYETSLYDFFHEKCSQQQVGENTLKHRSVVHFGYKFLYGSNNIDRNHPMSEGIPKICQPIIQKMVEQKIIDFHPDQLTINQYQPGQGIPPHIDTHSAFEDGIISLSLNSQVTMEFADQKGKSKAVLLPRRSLLVMKGESRYLLPHGITPRKFDIIYTKDIDQSNLNNEDNSNNQEHLTIKERGVRISLTFRKILHTPCACAYASKCDSQTDDSTKKNWYIPATQNEASNLEGELVYKVYEEIAEHFSDTRHSPWPRVKHFLCNLPNNGLVADVGCGNGKYLAVNNKLVMLGSDRSFGLTNICQERGHQVIVSDCLSLPYRSATFDGCICIAVIHHLSTEDRRLDAIKELVRIVRSGGRILIYVWALEQQLEEKAATTDSTTIHNVETNGKNNHESVDTAAENYIDDISIKGGDSNYAQNNTIEKHCIQVCEGRNTFQQQDLLIPWHLKSNKTKIITNEDETKQSSSSKSDDSKEEGEEKIFHRFYHVFVQGELRTLCRRIENISIEEIYLDCGNWCAILVKK